MKDQDKLYPWYDAEGRCEWLTIEQHKQKEKNLKEFMDMVSPKLNLEHKGNLVIFGTGGDMDRLDSKGIPNLDFVGPSYKGFWEAVGPGLEAQLHSTAGIDTIGKPSVLTEDSLMEMLLKLKEEVNKMPERKFIYFQTGLGGVLETVNALRREFTPKQPEITQDELMERIYKAGESCYDTLWEVFTKDALNIGETEIVIRSVADGDKPEGKNLITYLMN